MLADPARMEVDFLPPRFMAWFHGRGWTPRRHQLEMVEQDLAMETVLVKPIEADVLLHAIDAAISSFLVRRNHRSRLARR